MNGTAMSFGASHQTFRDQLASALRRMHLSAKEIARRADATPRSVENWRATGAMSAEALIRLAREFEDVWLILKAECGRADSLDDAEAMVRRVRELVQERRDA